jgi:hypothetical protein
VRDILRDAAKDESTQRSALGTRIASRFTALHLKEEELPALPWQRLKPMSFEERFSSGNITASVHKPLINRHN